MEIKRGFRDKLERHLDINNEIEIALSTKGNAVYDSCCFGVDSQNKLSDDRYMIFYNQPASPENSVRYEESDGTAKYRIKLSDLPASIVKLVFTVSIDGSGAMGDIASHTAEIRQNNSPLLRLDMTGDEFHSEKAVISLEIYRKDVWRVAAVASGFNGGLEALLRAYGGELADDSSSAEKPVEKPSPTPTPVNLTKVELKKGEKIILDKNCSDVIIVENGWSAKCKDYDLKALVRYRNGKTLYVGAANVDECLQTVDGAVRHGGDIKTPGASECIYIKWHPDIASVAVSSYSAIENGVGSFYKNGVYAKIKNGNQIVEIPAKSVSANPQSYTLCFGEIIYGDNPGELIVSALEMYSMPCSERRIGYKKDKVVMDKGPIGRKKT